MKKRYSRKYVIFDCIILILVLATIVSGLWILESIIHDQEQNENQTAASKTIVRDRVHYFPRQDIRVLLVMGIDQAGAVVPSQTFNAAGAADMVALMIFDEKNQESRLLVLNRDTMVRMPMLGLGGKKAGTFYGQLTLSHTFGTGMEDSCENTRETVSELLYGLSIDYYLAMNMDAVPILNDAVGGVTVRVTEDFSQTDLTIPMGEVKLMGQQALHYVRSRKGVSDQLNGSRMERQKQYMESFLSALQQKTADNNFVLSTYEQLEPYLVTDCSSVVFSELLQRYGEYPLVEIISPEGQGRVDEYYEFYLDEERLDELILRLFYAPK